MKGHLYKFSITRLEDSDGNPVEPESLEFEARNYDEIFNIVEAVKNKVDFDEDDAIALAVGIKLFSEVMLKNSKHELFKPLRPSFAKFMKQLKSL